VLSPSIRVLQKLKSDATIKSYVRGSWLTRDHSAAGIYDADQSISKDISAKILTELFDTGKRVISDAEVMDRPLLLFSASADKVVKRRAIDALYDNYGSDQKVHLTLKGARHAIFHDLCRQEVCDAIKRFAERCFTSFTPTRLEADHEPSGDDGGVHANSRNHCHRLHSKVCRLSCSARASARWAS
jgi:alpha-beta hydrolase superfamily lysophospholipase